MIEYAVEKLDTCLEEIEPLLREHYHEIAWYKDKIPYDPDFERYQTIEDAGILHIVTARDEGKLIGYFVSLISYGMHYMSTKYAVNDVLFLHPDYRNGMTAYKMFKYAFKVLKDDEGVDCITIHMKTDFPFDRLCESLGMRKQEYLYSIYVGE